MAENALKNEMLPYTYTPINFNRDVTS